MSRHLMGALVTASAGWGAARCTNAFLYWTGNPLEFNTSPGRVSGPCRQADVAQLVERNLAKVEVASSSLVVRSKEAGVLSLALLVEWPRGEATACKAVYTGSNPVSTSKDD
jgi:hypothetical protein